MARSRRTLDRRTLREQGEAAERQKDDETEEKEDEEEEEEDEDEEAEAEGEAEAEPAGGEEDDGEGGDDDDEEKPKKKKVVKKKAPPKVKAKSAAKPRSRAAKVVRMKVVWAVYSNSHSVVEEFPYPKKAEAEAYLAKITNDKKSGGPFFLQPLKKPFDKD